MYFICTGQTHGSYLPEQWEIKIINVRNKTQGDIRCPLYMYGGMCQKLWLPWLAHKNWLWHLIRCFFFASISFWNGNWQSHKADGVFRLVYCCTNTSLKSLNLWSVAQCHKCIEFLSLISLGVCFLFPEFPPSHFRRSIIKIIIFTKNLRPSNYNCQLCQPQKMLESWISGLLLIKHNFCVNKSECNLRTKSMSGFICCPNAEGSGWCGWFSKRFRSVRVTFYNQKYIFNYRS